MRDKIEEVVLDPQDLMQIGAKTDNVIHVKPKGCGARHTFTILAFFGFVNVMSMNVCLSVAIVAMVTQDGTGREMMGSECGFDETADANFTTNSTGDFDWDSQDQGIILGAYFYGNIATQILGGILAEKIGGKWVFGLGAFLGSIASLLTPVAARAGIGYIVVARAILGMGQGLTYTSITSMASRWIPAQERTVLCTIIFTGANVGIVLALSLSGYLSSEFGWEYVFYLFGGCSLLWLLFWIILIENKPSQNKRISKDELFYIEQNTSCNTVKPPFPPLFKIFTTPAFIGLLLTHIGSNWGSFIIITELPTYLNNIQHVSLKSNGLLSALPFFLMSISSNLQSFCADKVISMKWLSVQNTRKVFNTISQIGPALALLGLSFIDCDPTLAIAYLCIALSFNAAMYSGFMLNHMELSPNYAGTLMGMTTTFANMTGFLGPLFTGAVTNNNQTMAAWRTVFLTTSGIYVLDSLAFIILGKSQIQSWNTI